MQDLAWALEATIATTARPPHAEPGCPNLAIGMAMARPGEDPGGTGARVLASIAARGHRASWLGYDRAYTAALPGRFHLPARALGYSRLPPRRLTARSTHRHHRPASTTQPGDSHATDPPEHPRPAARAWNKPCTAARADVRPHEHNQKRSPNEFCRHDTGSSVR